MANEQIAKFMALVEKDVELQNKIREADAAFSKDHKTATKKEAVEAIILPIAKAEGFTFTAEEFTKNIKQQTDEVDENELVNVSGGTDLCCLIGDAKGSLSTSVGTPGRHAFG